MKIIENLIEFDEKFKFEKIAGQNSILKKLSAKIQIKKIIKVPQKKIEKNLKFNQIWSKLNSKQFENIFLKKLLILSTNFIFSFASACHFMRRFSLFILLFFFFQSNLPEKEAGAA